MTRKTLRPALLSTLQRCCGSDDKKPRPLGHANDDRQHLGADLFTPWQIDDIGDLDGIGDLDDILAKIEKLGERCGGTQSLFSLHAHMATLTSRRSRTGKSLIHAWKCQGKRSHQLRCFFHFRHKIQPKLR